MTFMDYFKVAVTLIFNGNFEVTFILTIKVAVTLTLNVKVVENFTGEDIDIQASYF
jgi:hypothetical protein